MSEDKSLGTQLTDEYRRTNGDLRMTVSELRDEISDLIKDNEKLRNCLGMVADEMTKDPDRWNKMPILVSEIKQTLEETKL